MRVAFDCLLRSLDSELMYAAWQIEAGESGRPHVQAVLVMKKRMEMSPMKRLLRLPTAHMEAVKSLPDAIKYCGKEESRLLGPFQAGVLPLTTQGQRSDLTEEIMSIMDEGMNPNSREFALAHPKGVVLRWSGLMHLYQLSQSVNRSSRPCVIILWGPGGVGKSTRADLMPGGKYYKDDSKWWDLYCNEQTVVYSDYGVSWGWTWNYFKRLTDWTPLNIPFKNGYGRFNSSTIILTTNEDPTTWWHFERLAEPGVWENRNIHVYKVNSIND